MLSNFLNISSISLKSLKDKMAAQQPKHRLTLDVSNDAPPTRPGFSAHTHPTDLPPAKATKLTPNDKSDMQNASLLFVGTATTILEWEGVRIMTDPNFLHAGDHVHLGPGVTGTRVTNPSVDLEQLPRIDAVLLSHYHADHFDQKVEASLRRDLPIISTPHARKHLHDGKDDAERFSHVFDLDFFENMIVKVQSPASTQTETPAISVTGMPGKHVPNGPLSVANDLLGAVPPTNGWMIELGHDSADAGGFRSGYRIYISGDTLLVDELKEIPRRYAGQKIDLMLVHLGGTTIPGPNMPLLMVTMDADQGIQLMQLIQPELTIPIHYDDYDVFLSPLQDFKKAVESAGWEDKVVYLDRGQEFKFNVRKE